MHIASGEFTFRFEKKHELGRLTPIWDDDKAATPGWTTFELELSANTDLEDLVTSLKDLHSLLLFLRTVHLFEITIDGRSSLLQKICSGGVTTIRCTGNLSEELCDNYLVFDYIFKPYQGEPKRKDIHESTITLAFPVTEDMTPVERDQEAYAFLPLRPYGFGVSCYHIFPQEEYALTLRNSSSFRPIS